MKYFALIFFVLLISLSAVQAQSPIVNTEADGKACVVEAKKVLSWLGIKIDRDIYIRVEPLEYLQTHSSGERSGDRTFAFYQAHSPEAIWIPKGYSKDILIPSCVHELVHAWQTTNCPLQDRAVSEGLACWAEMRACLFMKRPDLAGRAMNGSGDPIERKVIQRMMEIDKKDGPEAVLNYAKKTVKFQN